MFEFATQSLLGIGKKYPVYSMYIVHKEQYSILVFKSCILVAQASLGICGANYCVPQVSALSPLGAESKAYTVAGSTHHQAVALCYVSNRIFNCTLYTVYSKCILPIVCLQCCCLSYQEKQSNHWIIRNISHPILHQGYL